MRPWWVGARAGFVALALASAELGNATAAGAQEPADPDTATVYELPPVRVEAARVLQSAERLPVTLSVRQHADIQFARPTVGLEESLVAVPGIHVSNRHNLAVDSRVAIRGMGARAGFGVRGVRILLDGIPLTMPDGQATLNNLGLGSAGRIEVVRGPASTLHGNAAGGVLAIRTETPPPGLGAETRVTLGDLGTGGAALRKFDLKLGGAGGAGDYLAAVSRLETDGFREHGRAEHTVFTGRVRRVLGGGELTAVMNAAHMPLAQNPGSLPLDSARLKPEMAWPVNASQDAGKSANQLQVGLGYSHPVGDGDIHVHVHGVDRSMENPLPFAYISLDRTAGGVRAVYRDAFVVGGTGIELTTGLDTEFQRDERREHANQAGDPAGDPRRNQRDAVDAAGPFLLLQLAASKHVDVLFGARYDAMTFRTTDRPGERENPDGRDLSGRRRFGAASQMAGILYRPAASLSIYTNIATSFQTPTTTELLNAPPAAGGTAAPEGFNPDLRPERARSVEVGIRGQSDRIRFEAAAFGMRVLDLLLPFQSEAEPGRDFYRNAAAARHLGVEAGVGADLGRRWHLEAAYTFGRFTFTESATDHVGNRVPGVPPHRIFAALRHRPTSRLMLEASIEGVRGFAVDDANQYRNPGYAVVDARVAWNGRIGSVSLAPFIGLSNLFDRRYNSSVVVNAFGARFYEPAPGRSIHVGLAAPWGSWGAARSAP